MKKYFFITLMAFSIPFSVFSEPLKVMVNKVDQNGVGEKIGYISIEETKTGLRFDVDVNGILPEGNHGFHVHEKADCGAGEKEGRKVAALLAGSHYDPEHTGVHGEPDGKGHLGDIPFLIYDKEGKIKMSVVAKRLKIEDVMNRSLVIHGGADNYADKLGGDRVACAIVR